MADTAAALVIQLSADVKSFQREMRAATGTFDAEGRKIERRQAQLKKNFENGFNGLGRNLTGALSAAAAIQFGRTILNMGDALSDASQQLGVTTQQLQGLDYAARVSGGSSEKLTQALSFLADGLGEAERGEGQMAEAMRRNGIQLGTTIQVLYDVADRVKGARTEVEKMNIATTYLGAKGGKSMVSFLNQGAAGLRALQAEAAKKGQILDEQTVARLDAAKDSFETLEKALVNIGAVPTSEFLNDLSTFLEALSTGNWRAGLKALTDQLPTIGGAALGGAVGGLPGAVIGGGIGLGVSHFLNPHEQAATPAVTPGQPSKRSAVPLSKADQDKAAKDAAKALRDANRIREVLAQAADDAARANEDTNDAMRDTVRAQDQALLARNQGSVHFAEIQKEVIQESARLDIDSLNDRKNAQLRALDLQEQAELDHLREIHATKEEEQKLIQSYADQRTSVEATAAQARKAIEENASAQIIQIRTREVEVSDEARQGLEDTLAAGLHGFSSLKDAAAQFIDQLAEMILRLYVIKPLLESIMGPSGTAAPGTGALASIFSAVGSVFGFADGGVFVPGQGKRPLKRFASGGVSNRAAIFGEAGPEAAVPLPDGRSIPVTLRMPKMPSIPAAARPVVQQFDLRGAVMTEDLLAQMNKIGQRAANEGAARGAQAALKVQPSRTAAFQMLGT